MSYLTMDQADRIYESARRLNIEHIPVRHAAFREFCRELKQFLRLLGDATSDSYWLPFVRWLKRYRFWCLSSPIPFNHSSVYTVADAASWEQHLHHCAAIYPDLAEPALRLLVLLRATASLPENPMMEALVRLIHAVGDSGMTIVISYRPALNVVEDQVPERATALRKAHLVTPSRFSALVEITNLIIVGSPGWFPPHLFTAPRAPTMYVVHYEWTSGRVSTPPLFATGVQPDATPVVDHAIATGGEDDLSALPVMQDAIQLLTRIRGDGPPDNGQFEEDARLFLLEGEYGVFLPVDSTALVIDLEEMPQPVVRKMVTNLEPGMFVLLRHGGGGDYIVPVADQLLGDRSASARQVQQHWKQLLRAYVATHGPGQTITVLRSLGAQHANQSNLRNWMANSSIRTWDHRDFEAIMRLVNQGHRFEEYWTILGQIDNAHRAAGRHIRRLLLRTVRQSDLRVLERKGYIDFELEEGSGIAISAYRILEAPIGTHAVPYTQLSRLLKMEADEQWLA